MTLISRAPYLLLLSFVLGLLSLRAEAQLVPGGPPAVGVVRAERQQITQRDEVIGRIQAVSLVAPVARGTGFLEKRLFGDEAEGHKCERRSQLGQPHAQSSVQARER